MTAKKDVSTGNVEKVISSSPSTETATTNENQNPNSDVTKNDPAKDTEIVPEAEEEEELPSVVWLKNVKYHGKRYGSGEESEVLHEDLEDLLASKVAKLVN